MQTTHDLLLQQARNLAPLLRAAAREGEQARRPLDRVIDAVRDTDLLGMMAPKRYGGLEMDIDTFFEVVLELSVADASMGWLIGFYIEHNFWYCHYPQPVQDEVYGDANHALASATLNIAAGSAKRVEGGYRVSGRWQWGTGIVHATWVMVGALVQGEEKVVPRFFLMPREQVQAIDNWHIAGMCATGSWDILVEDVFVPEDRAQSLIDMLNTRTGITRRYDAAIYKTPLIPLLSFAAATPILGAAKMALNELQQQTKSRLVSGDPGIGRKQAAKFLPTAEAALTIETAELLLRGTLSDMMSRREGATIEMRCEWTAKVSHAVGLCRDAVQTICMSAGASGQFLDNPLQRALRDINTASCHVIFDRTIRYGDYGALLFEQPVNNALL